MSPFHSQVPFFLKNKEEEKGAGGGEKRKRGKREPWCLWSVFLKQSTYHGKT